MKSCPFCGEEIRDAAMVCEHCGGEFSTPTHVTTTDAPAEPPIRRRQTKGLVVLLGVGAAFVAVIVMLYTQFGHESSLVVSQTGTAVASQSPSPQAIAIASASDIDIDAGKIVGFDWIVPNHQPNCHLTGHIEVTDSSGDVRVFVTTADEYKNLVSGRATTTYLATEKTTAVTLDVRVTTPGPMVLAIANTAAFSGKRVGLRDVKATCT